MAFQEILANIALRVRQSLELEDILKTTVAEVHQWLDADRVLLYRFNPDWSGIVTVESVRHQEWSIIGQVITDSCFEDQWIHTYRLGQVTAHNNIYQSNLSSCHLEFLEQYQVKANLVVPILLTVEEQSSTSSFNPRLWGLLIAHECSQPRNWQPLEIDFLQRLATHVAIAIQQATLIAQLKTSNQALELEISNRQQAEQALQQLNGELEQRIEQRTRELKRANQELLRSNQELEKFAYLASHDLREPLRMVTSFTKLLSQRYAHQLDEEADKIIGFAVDGAMRMEKLIDDLLDYSQVSKQNRPFSSINCEEVLDISLHNLQLLIEDTETTINRKSLPTVQGDRFQLIRLFQNLIDNAIKYRASALPIIEIASETQTKQYLFWVKDNGIGIDPQYNERIFQIFQRLHTRQEYTGTGIGLAICQKIVELHQGKIWVESQLGQGATFYFTIPRYVSSQR